MHLEGRRGTLKWARCLTFYPSLFYPGTGIVWRTWIRHPLWSLSTTHSLSLENKCFEGRGLFSCSTVYSDLNGIILLKENALGWVPGSFKSTFNFTICLIVPFRLPFPGVLHFSVLSRPPLHSYCCTGFLCFSLLPSVFQHFVPLSENDSWKRKSLSPSGQPKTKMPVWLGSLAGIRWLNASPAKSEDRTSLSFSFTKPLIL